MASQCACGFETGEYDVICSKCGGATPRGLAWAPPIAQGISLEEEVEQQRLDQGKYDDFGVCVWCHSVNLRSSPSCSNCKQTGILESIESATGRAFGVTVAWTIGLAAVPLLVLFPFGTVIGFTIIGVARNIHRRSKLGAIGKRNRYQRAAVDLMSSLARSQRNEADLQYEAGRSAFESGSFESATEKLRTSIQLGRDDMKVRFVLAASYYNRQEYSLCIPMLEAIVNDDMPAGGSHELLARSYLAVGISAPGQVDFLLAHKSGFSTKLRNAATLAVARYLEVTPPLDASAVPVLGEACNLEPEVAGHVTALMQIAADQLEWASGLTYASRLEIGGHHERGIAIYSRCLIEVGDLSDNAVAVFKKQLANHPEDTDSRMRLAQAQIKKKAFADAIGTYESGLAHNGSDIKLRYHLALTHLMAERVEDAIAELQALLRTDGVQAYRSKDDIYRLLGRCFIRKGMLSSALKQYLLAERSQENIQELYNLGQLFESRGDAVNARECWEEIYATDVRFRDVSAKLAAVVK